MVLSGGGYAIDYNTINIDDNRLTTGSADLSGGIHFGCNCDFCIFKKQPDISDWPARQSNNW
ncbi:MAG: hypothetical protein IPK25_19240 [Saprospiraceae bacterium]|nr:hypothetical protein [Saprospiraceae bacterium]